MLTDMVGTTSAIKGHQKGGQLSCIAYCFGTLFVLWVIGFAAFTFYAIQPADSDVQAPVAVVFTGGSGRIQKGLSLLGSGRIERLFVSGVTEGTTPAVFESVYPDAQSLENGALSLGYDARTTQENALEVKEWLQENDPNGDAFLLITSDYHMPRSLKEMRYALPERVNIMPCPLPSTDLPPLRRLGHFFSEYNKFLVQSIIYGLVDLVDELMGHKTERPA